MNPDDYDDYVKSKFLSWEEAGLEEKRILLATRINIEPNDVDACIKFVRLQDQLMAFKESGIAAAEVRNKRALYQIKQSIISKSLRSNRSSIALRLEMLDVAEACYGFNSDEFSDMEGRLINEFPNNIVMWEALLRKRQNKLANFESTEMLGMIDRCLSNMLRYRGNGLNSEAATDDFLVSLVVYRCKLLIECGFADQAVASLQALTEFHFFPLMDQSLVDEKFVDKFKNFWTQGIPRIGDDGSLGWSRSKTNALAPSEECADLQKELLKIRKKEELILATCSQKTGVTAEIWRQLETFRNQASWRPVRSPGTPHELYEFASRKVSFEEVRPLLFPFSDKSCAEYLVFKILQLFGAVIPGMKDDSHEGILRRLSSDLFPSCSLRYESMSEFLDKFLLLLSSAEEADVVRILSARELTYAHLQLSGPDLDAGAREKAVNLRKRTLESVDNINEAENLAITFYMLKSYENSGDRAGSLKLFKFLSMVFSALSSCIWSIQSLRDRLIYLRMAKAFCRRLPAAADQLSPGAPKTLTKKSFLLRLGVQGNARELTNELEQKDRAWNSWMACLKDSANSAHSKFDWLANEAEIILELAAAFFSEVTDGGLMKKWKVFDRAATESPLAKSLKDRPAVQKLRCKFYSNEVKKSKAFSPKLLLRLLKDGMETFSDEIYFVKKFIELSHHFDAVVYLKINPGISWLQRRIRCSALLVLGLKKYAQEGQNPARILQEVISIAVREENKLVLPDAYLWCWLLSHDAVKKSARGMEEAFALAREHCPWSKQLILESIKTRGLFKEILPETAKMFYSSGLQMYWDPDEISRQLVL